MKKKHIIGKFCIVEHESGSCMVYPSHRTGKGELGFQKDTFKEASALVGRWVVAEILKGADYYA